MAVNHSSPSVPAIPHHLEHNAFKYRPDIDGLRAIAVLAVVGFHAFPAWIQGGFVGVDIFFVISGFLISGILFKELDNSSYSIVQFYLRRIRRIFPALLLVLFLSSVLAWFILLPGEYQQFGTHVLAGVGFVANLVLWSESGYFDSAVEAKPLLHLWSLGVEEQFYIVWPLLLALIWKTRSHIAWVLGGLALASLGLNLWQTGQDATAAFYAPYTRFWELLIGAALAYWRFMQKDPTPALGAWRASGLSATGLGLILASCTLLDKTQVFPGWRAVLPVAGSAMLIATGPHAWVNRHVLANRVMVWIGLISFPLYLWHWPLLSFAHILDNATPTRPIRLAMVLLSFVLAWLTYQWVEKPVRYQLKGHRPLLVLIILALALAGWGALGMQGKVAPRHTNPDLQRVLEASKDWAYPDHLAKMQIDGQRINYLTAGTSSTLMLGDSHIEQYSPRILALRQQQPNRLNTVYWSTTGGCPPIPQVFNGAQQSCDKALNAALALIRQRPVENIVIGGCWNCYFNPPPEVAMTSCPSGQGLYFMENGQKADLQSEQGKLKAMTALGQLLATLSKTHKVYLLLDNPQHANQAPARYLRGSRWSALHLLPVSHTAIALDDATLALHAQLRQLAAQAGAETIDPLPSLCRDGNCAIASRDGQFLYKDNNHLRASYVAQQASYLDHTVLTRRPADIHVLSRPSAPVRADQRKPPTTPPNGHPGQNRAANRPAQGDG